MYNKKNDLYTKHMVSGGKACTVQIAKRFCKHNILFIIL